MKNVTSDFWYRVYTDCEQVFPQITHLNQIKKQQDPKHHELQIWCADMWAVLWNGWTKGNETEVVKEMDFCWGTDTINRWEETTIYHNAGVTCACGGKFYKANYRESLPYNLSLRTKDDNCSHLYYQEIKEVETKTCLL
jgi:hypothetical protein